MFGDKVHPPSSALFSSFQGVRNLQNKEDPCPLFIPPARRRCQISPTNNKEDFVGAPRRRGRADVGEALRKRAISRDFISIGAPCRQRTVRRAFLRWRDNAFCHRCRERPQDRVRHRVVRRGATLLPDRVIERMLSCRVINKKKRGQEADTSGYTALTFVRARSYATSMFLRSSCIASCYLGCSVASEAASSVRGHLCKSYVSRNDTLHQTVSLNASAPIYFAIRYIQNCRQQ